MAASKRRPRHSVSVAIMAHPKRAPFIPGLQARIGHRPEVVWDRVNDRWDTGRRSLLAYNPRATHHMVIQDDAVVCRDLVTGVQAALAEVPEQAILGLYLGRTRAWKPIWQQLQRTRPDMRWVRMRELMWGVGVVVPTALVDQIVELGDQFRDIPNYDSRISAAAMRLKVPFYYPWPSLVSHRQSPSLIEGRGWRGRYAYRFIGAGASALAVRWRGAVVDVHPPRQAIGRSRRRAREAGAGA